MSVIYKMIRKDIKVNGQRKAEKYWLQDGDEVAIYISDEDYAIYKKEPLRQRAKRQFTIIYEDDNILLVNKPYGLLTHGDSKEKKNHLANQVLDYLIETGSYDPKKETSFSPASVNRLDRNTTGLVLFGKNSKALRELNFLIRRRSGVEKYYLTIVHGKLKEELVLSDLLVKNHENNMVQVIDADSLNPDIDGAKNIDTIVRPIESKNDFTIVEVQILTGRTHQIRAHLASAGYPLIGDPKYGNHKADKQMKVLNSQLLHAWKMRFNLSESDTDTDKLDYLDGMEFEAPLPDRFLEIKRLLRFD